MAGGIVQIAMYGSQDIFLTGAPQITFFKIVYRRCTNFAIESIQQQFIGLPNFGQETISVIDKAGDLMNKAYLEITLPKIDLVKKSATNQTISPTIGSTTDKAQVKNKLDLINKYYQLVRDYVSINTDLVRNIRSCLKTNNLSVYDIRKNTPVDKLVSAKTNLQLFIAKSNIFDIFNSPDLMPTNCSRYVLVQQINTTDIKVIFDSVIRKFSKSEHSQILIRKELNRIIDSELYVRIKEFYLGVHREWCRHQQLYKNLVNNTHTERYQFAWVEEIGHAIVDYIDVQIGGQQVDKHTGDWLSLFSNTSMNIHQMKNYHKMIGNVKELTIFDDNVKNIYKLIIPLQFWFCRYTGLSVPLSALRYHDITFTLRLKELSKLCYFGCTASIFDQQPINIGAMQNTYDINIVDAKLYVDYVYLDTDERIRFAKSTHEYLIEVVQYDEFETSGSQFIAHLNFINPTKYIVWFAQPVSYRENLSGRDKCQWNNYGTNSDKTGNPFALSKIRLNLCDRIHQFMHNDYYNYIQPYEYFASSPADGINVYSFAINPLEHQPSGSINASRLDDFSIVANIDEKFMLSDKFASNKNIYFAAYSVSYNILRIMGGMGHLAFQK